MNSTFLSRLFSGRGKLGCFGVILLFAVMVVATNFIGDFLGKQQRPQRYAQIYGCLGEPENGVYYINTCDEPIHLRYCFYTEPGTHNTVCRTSLLQPGEGVSTVISDRLAMRAAGADIWSSQIWACKLPFLPDMVPNIHKRTQMERGCRKPDDEQAPPVGPDPELQAALNANEAP
ncbi:MAG: hypothetical protein CMK09_17320 [Ponticaulis sp.]|nr:hypothetical protein [Ponticaulis sp.]|tara:strand:- start:22193 stop:22717 length:525 start_codon:yes stop_codon:yes gene_type:complete